MTRKVGSADADQNASLGLYNNVFLSKIKSVMRKRTPDGYMPVEIHFLNNEPTPHIGPVERKHGYVNVPQSDDTDFTQEDWYMGPMSRDTAAERLKAQPNGTFLVRDSENPARRGYPALSIKYSGNVRHIKIEKNSEGMYFMSDTRFFHSLPLLVEFYQQNELSDSFPEVNTTLIHPYKTVAGQADLSVGLAELSFSDAASNGVMHSPSSHVRSPSMPKQASYSSSGMRILSFATAVFDYAATATTQLSLVKGDRVMVLSKTGQDKGWWKGEHCDSGAIGYFPYAYVREEDDD